MKRADSTVHRILFVCMGNICRSPAAEVVVRTLVHQTGLIGLVEVDSAGTHAYHAGESVDPRARRAAARRNYDLRGRRARRVEDEDFGRFDKILAMDKHNLAHLRRICPPEHQHKLGLFLDYARNIPQNEIPDPYYGGEEGFEIVFDLCERAAKGLLETLTASTLPCGNVGKAKQR